MALALILRNNCKFGATRALQHVNFNPVATYSTALASQATKMSHVRTLKQESMGRIALPTRSISVTSPKLASEGKNHAAVWNIDRGIILAMMVVIPAAFIAPSQTLDSLLATAVVVHQHWGLEAMVIDYVRPSVVGPFVAKLTLTLLYVFSVGVIGGLFYLIYADIGLAKSIKKLWSVKGGT